MLSLSHLFEKKTKEQTKKLSKQCNLLVRSLLYNFIRSLLRSLRSPGSLTSLWGAWIFASVLDKEDKNMSFDLVFVAFFSFFFWFWSEENIKTLQDTLCKYICKYDWVEFWRFFGCFDNSLTIVNLRNVCSVTSFFFGRGGGEGWGFCVFWNVFVVCLDVGKAFKNNFFLCILHIHRIRDQALVSSPAPFGDF